MTTPPQSFMIFQEELRKAKLEKERLKQEYEARIAALSEDMELLKEQLSAQQQMMKTVTDYATGLEQKLQDFKVKLDRDHHRNSNGFH